LTRTETVTVLNDMAIMAPAALIDPAIRWRQIDDLQVEATFTDGPNEVRAVLVFDATGALANFWSDDRPALDADGVTLQPQRWSTPVGAYRSKGSAGSRHAAGPDMRHPAASTRMRSSRTSR
jgi:hypothetical protein